jgi:adenylate cyclase
MELKPEPDSRAFNAGIHTERQIVLRIGINVGDIIVDGDDIFGDGVNVAARLEALCEPGGVCISRSANEQVRNKLSLAFADLGEQTVKNIAQSVGVFGLAAKDIASLPEGALPHERTEEPVAAATTSRAPRPMAYSPEDRRMSIMVLPFENSSGDPRQDDLAAGITRDVTDRFARDPEVPVIPSATAAGYRGKTVNLQTLGLDHNVHFVLTGSARRQDGRVIVSATLYEAESGRNLWSQRFDRPDNSDEWVGVIGQISGNCNTASIEAEVARAMREHPESLDKRDLLLAEIAFTRWSSKEDALKQIALIERALTIDPDYVRVLGDKANAYVNLVFAGYSDDPSADLSTAMKAVDRALQLAPNNLRALRRKATVLRAQGDLDGATALIRKILELEPLDGYKYRELGIIQITQGQGGLGELNDRKAARLPTAEPATF